jgi:hypothetical protein
MDFNRHNAINSAFKLRRRGHRKQPNYSRGFVYHYYYVQLLVEGHGIVPTTFWTFLHLAPWQNCFVAAAPCFERAATTVGFRAANCYC